MTLTVRNYEDLVEKLDEDTQWRKKEIVDMKTLCSEPSCPASFLRAAFVLCCAHFEGSIKFTSNAYVAYISSLKIKNKDLRTEISSIIVKKRKQQYFGLQEAAKVKVSVVSDLLDCYNILLDEDFFVKVKDNDLPISTNSNPTPDVLQEISKILGINYSDIFEIRAPFINAELLKPRNLVAHGERRPITMEELSSVTIFVMEIIDLYKEQILTAAQANLHMKNLK